MTLSFPSPSCFAKTPYSVTKTESSNWTNMKTLFLRFTVKRNTFEREASFAFHQCVPGSIPGPGVICGLSLLVLYSAPRGFSPGTPVFPSPQKPTFDLIWFDLFDLQSPQLVQHSCSARMIWDSNKVIINNKLLLPEFYSNTNLKLTCNGCCVFKFLKRGVDEKHLMRFQSQPRSQDWERPWGRSCFRVRLQITPT